MGTNWGPREAYLAEDTELNRLREFPRFEEIPNDWDRRSQELLDESSTGS